MVGRYPNLTVRLNLTSSGPSVYHVSLESSSSCTGIEMIDLSFILV